jgi:protein-S-isoprenylcysteine O-methyltransferase Ste14
MHVAAPRAFNQRIRIWGLRIGGLALIPLLFLTHPYFHTEGFAYEAMELVGVLMIIAGVLGRFWSILYVGRHKNRAVVADGPYSITRNPLYLFSTVGAFGVGLMFGKLTLALMLGGGVFIALWLTARREQAYLLATFGDAYADYAARVPMFLPNPALYRSEETIVVSAGALRRNLLDAFVFLSAIPLAELSETLYGRFDLLPFILP